MDSPEWIHLTGKGTFLFDSLSLDSSFSLYRNPYRIKIVLEGVEQKTALSLYGLFSSGRGTAQFTGALNDGRLVSASALQLTTIDEFEVMEGISFGQTRESYPSQSRYSLTGYFGGAFALSHDGWSIENIPCADSDSARELAKNWRIPVEGSVLQLKRKDATVDEHRDFARVIMTLLSIASGTGVSCDRHFLTWDTNEVEMWRQWTGDEIGPGPVVPDFEIAKFLEQALLAWETLSQEQRDTLRLARDYINLSALGYLDRRLLRIHQPWEFLTEAWDIKAALSDSEARLRTELLGTWKNWRKEYPDSDINGYWGSHISLIFDWPKLRDAIRKLAGHFGISIDQVGFDLDFLKKARDSVAHSGRLPRDPDKPKRRSLDSLTSGQYCLQLLLLRILEYQGKVYHSTGGIRTIVDINEASSRART